MKDRTSSAKDARGLLRFLDFMPLIFAFGFLVPVIAQGIESLGWDRPLGTTPMVVALLVGGGWGLVAQIRGRWI